MANSGNKFRLLLQADINEKNVVLQLNNLSKKYIFKLNVQLDNTVTAKIEQQIGQIQNKLTKTNKSVKLFDVTDINRDLSEIQARFNDVKSSVSRETANWTLFDDEGIGKATRATVQFKDEIGRSHTETYKLVQLSKELSEELGISEGWVYKRGKAVDQEVNRTQKLKKEYEQMSLYADKFIKRSGDLGKSKDVTQGIDVANRLKLAVENKDIDGARKLRKELDVLDASIRQSGNSAYSWSKELGIALKRTIEWASAVGLVYAAIRKLGEGAQYIKDLDKTMIDIKVLQVQGARSNEEIEKLANNFNDLAKEMSVTTQEVALGSVEWLKQGKTIQETNALLKSTMMLSKLGAVSSSEATELLTSTMNAYKLSAGDAEDVVSKLVAVDNIASTSVKEVATAMQRSAVSAQDAKVSMEELIAMVGTVSSVSRRESSSIGEAFKSMFARISDIQKGGLDEDGIGINQVEESLKRVNIELRNGNGEWRNFADIISDVAKGYDKWGEEDQKNVAKAIAGVRQRESFLVLIKNQSLYQKLLNEQVDAGGLAADRYAKYLEGVEASTNRLQASWESLWQTTINPGVFTFFNNLLSAVLNLISAMGGLVPLITGIVSSFTMMNGPAVVGAIISLKTKLAGIIATLTSVETAAMSTGAVLATSLGAVGLAITGIVVAYNLFQSAVEDSEEKLARLNKELSESSSKLKSIKDSQKALNDLGTRYDELKAKSKLNNDEQKEFIDIQNKIKDMLPQIKGTYDQFGNFVMDTTTKVSNLNKELDKQRKNQEELVAAKAKQTIGEQYKQARDKSTEVENLGKVYESYLSMQDKGPLAPMAQQEFKRVEILFKQGKVDLDSVLSDLYTSFSQMEPTAQEDFKKTLNALEKFDAALLKELTNTNDSIPEAMPLSGSEEVIKTFAEILKDVDDATSVLVDAMKESNSEQGLSNETVQKLIEANEDYIDMLEFEGDKITLNKHAVRQHTIAIIDEKIAMAESTDATGRKATILRALKKQMMENINGIRELRDAEADYKDILDLVIDRIREKKEQEKEALQDQIDAIKDNLDAQKDIIAENLESLKEKYENEKEYIQDNLDLLQEKLDAEKEASDARLDALEKERDAQKEIIETEIKNLDTRIEQEKEQINTELENQKKILEARKEAIDLLKDEIKYQDELADKQKSIARLQAEIEELRLDNSLEARAKRLQLEDQLSGKQKELSNFQRDKAIEDETRLIDDEINQIEESSKVKIEALELEYKAEKEILEKRMEDLSLEYERQKEIESARIKLLEDEYEKQQKIAEARSKSIDDEVKALELAAEQKIELLEREAKARELEFEKQIDAIDEYLKQNGTIIKEAMRQLAEGNETLYQDLISWNSTYGTGIDTDITAKWVNAIAKAKEYLGVINNIKTTASNDEYVPATGSTMGTPNGTTHLPSDPWQNIATPSYHSGASLGPVGGRTNASGEQFAKLMAGEVVTTPSQMDKFIRKTLPAMVSGDFKSLFTGGDANVKIENLIKVEGNLDQTVMPDLNVMIDKAIVKLTESFKQKGMIRRTQSYA